MSILNKILFLSLSRSHRDKKLNKIKNTIKNLCNIFLILISTLLLKSCNTTEPPGNQTLTIKLEDVSCTEAWIQLTTNNLQLPTTINILKNNTVAQTFSLSTQDTLLYIDSLLPNQTYKFKVVLTNNPQPTSYPQPPTSNELSITTMDTTSHNFTWQSWEFGDAGAGSSTLYDVAIIDENNIWAVGEIYMLDSLGRPDPNAYNAVHWDGTKWELKRIMFYTFCPQGTGSGSYPATSIFAFDNENIVISSGSQLAYLKNGIQIKKECIPVSVNKLWGSSSSDLYAVGNNGNIAHWDGMKWTKIESGTDLDFLDIYGANDTKTNNQQILAVCSRNLPLDKGIYKIEGNTAIEIPSEPIQWQLAGVWFIPNRHYYVVGAGIYEKNFLTDSKWKENALDITHYITPKIRGNNLNDVFAVGAFGEALHFNGVSWRSYIEETGINSGGYFSVSLVNNTLTAVGYKNQSAVVVKGKRIY